jgi:chromate reductase
MRPDGQLDIVTLCGSIRQRSYNAALVRALPSLAPGAMGFIDAPLIVNIPHYDADAQELSGAPAEIAKMAAVIREADGLIIVSPEYNYSVPGALKNAIDWLSRVPKQPLARKPVMIQSVSGGALGGARMQYHLRHILVSLDALVFNRPEIMIGLAGQKFDEHGHLVDEATRKLVTAQLSKFDEFVREQRRSE